MKLKIIIFLFIIFLLFFITACGNIVTSVTDGDTFILNNTEHIRILEIDTPELGQPGSIEAWDYLSSLIFNKNVTIKKWKTDKYGRTLAYVFIDSQDVGKLMIKAGYSDYIKPY